MLDALKTLFFDKKPETGAIEPRLAVAALLVHLAHADGEITEPEHAAIERALKEQFDLDDRTVAALIEEARRHESEAVDFYRFTSILARLPEPDRIDIVRMMWQVVFADSSSHEFEDNIVWRVAELIGVPARERTRIRAQMRP